MRRRWLGFVIAAVALAIGLWAWPRLPPRIATHWNVRGVPDGYSSRLFAVLMVPGIILALNGLFRLLPRIDPRRLNYAKFPDTYWLIANAVCLFLLGLHVLVIVNGLGYPVAMSRLVPAGMGLLFVVLGNYLSRVQPTWFVGIRTPWTLSSDAVWRKTHRAGGVTFVLAGLLMIAAAFASPAVNWIVFAVAIAVAITVPVVLSYVWWRRETRGGGTSALIGVLTLVSLLPSGRRLSGQAADTLPPAAVAESTFRFRSGDLTIEGTLTVPRAARGPVPLGIIIAGSGPTDRNGNAALGLRTNAYAQLAWRLGEQGIATLRYDKRGLGGSRGPVDPSRVTLDDFAADARAAADTLRRDRRFATIVFLGHSEGAWLALRAAQLGAPVSGVALLEGAGRPFLALLRWQLARQLDSTTLIRYDSAMARYVRGEDPGDVPPALGILFLAVNRTFVQSAAAFEPLAAVAAVRAPVLIVQGDADLQVGVEDARLLQRARPDARLVLLTGVNHVLKRVVGEGLAAQGPLYTDPTTPVAPQVVAAIADWARSLAR